MEFYAATDKGGNILYVVRAQDDDAARAKIAADLSNIRFTNYLRHWEMAGRPVTTLTEATRDICGKRSPLLVTPGLG